GTPFVGWQMQENGRSVQQALTEALERLTQERVAVHGAGRTDAGVHALGQVAHFDLARDRDERTIRDGLNFHLKPEPVSVLRAERAADDFHARFDATRRRYVYRILNRRAPPALDRDRVWWVPAPLDAAAMDAAARVLVGRHDFTTFRSAQCQARSPVKPLDGIAVTRRRDLVEVSAWARSFLHHQVRSMVGTLQMVGAGDWEPARVAEALEARSRAACGPVAPACGRSHVAAGDGDGSVSPQGAPCTMR